MHVALTVPLWALVAAGVPAWGAISVLVGRFITVHTKGRWPSFIVGGLSFLWPMTLAMGLVAFPAWMVVWLGANYGEALKRFLGKDIFPARAPVVSAFPQVIRPGSMVELVRVAEELPALALGSKGIVQTVDENYGKVHCHWTTPDGRPQSGYVFRDRIRVIA